MRPYHELNTGIVRSQGDGVLFNVMAATPLDYPPTV